MILSLEWNCVQFERNEYVFVSDNSFVIRIFFRLIICRSAHPQFNEPSRAIIYTYMNNQVCLIYECCRVGHLFLHMSYVNFKQIFRFSKQINWLKIVCAVVAFAVTITKQRASLISLSHCSFKCEQFLSAFRFQDNFKITCWKLNNSIMIFAKFCVGRNDCRNEYYSRFA